jgi:hypothetical protein
MPAAYVPIVQPIPSAAAITQVAISDAVSNTRGFSRTLRALPPSARRNMTVSPEGSPAAKGAVRGAGCVRLGRAATGATTFGATVTTSSITGTGAGFGMRGGVASFCGKGITDADVRGWLSPAERDAEGCRLGLRLAECEGGGRLGREAGA